LKGKDPAGFLGMKVKLSLYGSLGSHLPGSNGGDPCVIEIETGTTIGEFFDRLNIPADAPKLIFLNGVHARRESTLKDGDEVGAFPPVAGG
jgi:molybdopterin converting factor small subunit